LPSWLDWDTESVLAGTPPTPADEEGYKVPIILTATYNAFGMSHVIESRLELDIRSPGSGMGDLASSLRNAANLQNVSSGNPVMESGMDAYLDDDDDDMMYVSGHAVFHSENNTPPSAITPSTTNPNQLLYVPSQSLQNSPLKQNMMGPTPPASGPSLSNRSMNPLTPTLSPASLQYNPHGVTASRQPSSAPQTPLGGPPSQLSLQIPTRTGADISSLSAPPTQQSNLRYDIQPPMMYMQNHLRLSPPTSESRMYGIDEEVNDISHGYFDDTYPVELGSPFLER
jgi:hypothetical protein